jgi:hypothetical protein
MSERQESGRSLREALEKLIRDNVVVDRRPRDKHGPIGRLPEAKVPTSVLLDLLAAHPAEAVRPMPTQEQIEAVISDELDGEGFLAQFIAPKLARRVVDLLNSEPIRSDYAECPDEECLSGGPHPISEDGTEMECRRCHVGFPNPFYVAGNGKS